MKTTGKWTRVWVAIARRIEWTDAREKLVWAYGGSHAEVQGYLQMANQLVMKLDNGLGCFSEEDRMD